VGDKIYLSHYHGGVYVLDASAAFAGRRERPKELGFIVPHDKRTRPLLGQPPLTGLLGRFFTDFPLGRPEIWDMVVHRGHVLASDMTGGLYTLKYDDSPLPLCADARRPRSVLSRKGSRLRSDRILLRGTASDRGCAAAPATRKRPGAVSKVSVAIARVAGTRCRFVSARGRLSKPRPCSKPVYLRAKGTERWRLQLEGSFPAGAYRIAVRARDGAGNRERARTATLRLRG